MRLIETDVSVHPNFAAGVAFDPGVRYRFERLPSQDQRAGAQSALEQIAQTALAKVGLLRAAESGDAGLSVLLGARSGTWIRDDEGRLYPSTGAFASPRFSFGIGIGVRSGYLGVRLPITYLHRHEISLILRDLRSARIVYETQAFHEGPWADTGVLYGVMLDAALEGFPRPAAAAVRVRREIPR